MVFPHPEFDDHEPVAFCRDAGADLPDVVAAHGTARDTAAACAASVAIRTLDLNIS